MVVYVCGLQLIEALATGPVQQHAKQSAASCCGACQRNDAGLCFMEGFTIVSLMFGSCIQDPNLRREGTRPQLQPANGAVGALTGQLGGGGGGGLGGSLHGTTERRLPPRRW